MRTLWTLGVVLMIAGAHAVAQETRGTITGTVHDAQGVIPGATVKVINIGTNGTQEVVTNGRGYFEAQLLVAGSYRVTVEMIGFKSLNRTGISLGSGQEVSLDLPLELGTLQ